MTTLNHDKHDPARREAQLAAIQQQRDLESYRKFQDVHVDVYLESKSFKMNNYGDWEFKCVIPAEQHDDVVAMSKVVGMPIHMHITKSTRNDDGDGDDDA